MLKAILSGFLDPGIGTAFWRHLRPSRTLILQRASVLPQERQFHICMLGPATTVSLIHD